VNIVHFMYVNFITITSVLDGSCSIATCLDSDTGLQSSSRLIEAARDRESRGKADYSTAVIRVLRAAGNHRVRLEGSENWIVHSWHPGDSQLQVLLRENLEFCSCFS